MEEKYIVIAEWNKSYQDTIVLQKDNKVIVDFSIKDSTPEWENWVWCISIDGKEGWVPLQILKINNFISADKKEALVLENYSADELTVLKDEILIGERILNGWLWCSKKNDTVKGWVPLNNVQIL